MRVGKRCLDIDHVAFGKTPGAPSRERSGTARRGARTRRDSDRPIRRSSCCTGRAVAGWRGAARRDHLPRLARPQAGRSGNWPLPLAVFQTRSDALLGRGNPPGFADPVIIAGKVGKHRLDLVADKGIVARKALPSRPEPCSPSVARARRATIQGSERTLSLGGARKPARRGPSTSSPRPSRPVRRLLARRVPCGRARGGCSWRRRSADGCG